MKSMLRFSLVWAALALLAGSMIGCVVKGSAETLNRFNFPDEVQTAAYTAGQDIRVRSRNGNVDLVQGSSATELVVTFKPYSVRGHSEEDKARDDVENDLNLTVNDDGQTIEVRVSREDGANSGLGADMVVELPSGFSGGIEIDADNAYVDADLRGGLPTFTTAWTGLGDLRVRGAAGQLNISTDQGDIDVSVQQWSASDGTVAALGLGPEVNFAVAPGLSGRIHATVSVDDPNDGTIVGPSSGEWTETVTSDQDKSYEFGAEAATAGLVTITAGDDEPFETSITITQQ